MKNIRLLDCEKCGSTNLLIIKKGIGRYRIKCSQCRKSFAELFGRYAKITKTEA